MMNIEIKITADSVEGLQAALTKLGSPVMTKVNITTDAPAIVQGGELAIPAGADLTVAGVTRDSVKITSDLTQEPMQMSEPEKPKARKKAAKQQAPADTPQIAPNEPEVNAACADTPQIAPNEPEVNAACADAPQIAPSEPIETTETKRETAAEAKGAPTLDQIANAGAALLDADASKMMPLLDLLRDFGVQAITQLKDDQLADFAARLRSLGAEV